MDTNLTQEQKKTYGVWAAVVVVLVLVFGGYAFYAHKHDEKILSTQTTSDAYHSAKDAVTPDSAASSDSSASMPVTGSTMSSENAASDSTK